MSLPRRWYGPLSCTAGLRGFSEFWLADWGDSAVQASDDGERVKRSAVYAGLVVAGLVLILLRSICYTRLNMEASRGMHQAMLASMIGAKIAFYDTTMLGRITNRFARDVEKMDMPLRMVTNMFLTTLAELLLGIVTVAVATKGALLALMVPLLLLFKLLHGYFARCPSPEELPGYPCVTPTPPPTAPRSSSNGSSRSPEAQSSVSLARHWKGSTRSEPTASSRSTGG